MVSRGVTGFLPQLDKMLLIFLDTRHTKLSDPPYRF
jgi:hypothetical protein